MAIPTNPVTVGQNTRKSDYDTLYDNAVLADTGGTAGGAQTIPGNKTFSGSSTVFDNDIQVGGTSALQQGHYQTGLHTTGTRNQNQMFDFIAPAVPTVGDFVTLNGSYGEFGAAILRLVSRAERASTSTITLYTCRLNTAAGSYTFGTVTVTDGSGSNLASGVSLAW